MLSAGKKNRISEEILPTLESQEVNFYGCFPLLPFCEPEDIFPLVVFISSERRQMNLSTSQRFSVTSLVWGSVWQRRPNACSHFMSCVVWELKQHPYSASLVLGQCYWVVNCNFPMKWLDFKLQEVLSYKTLPFQFKVYPKGFPELVRGCPFCRHLTQHHWSQWLWGNDISGLSSSVHVALALSPVVPFAPQRPQSKTHNSTVMSEAQSFLLTQWKWLYNSLL